MTYVNMDYGDRKTRRLVTNENVRKTKIERKRA